MSYLEPKDNFARNVVIGAVVLLATVLMIMTYLSSEMDKKIDEGVARWQAEHDMVESMSCAELKDGMLYNKIKASDNKQRATERFLGMECQP